MIKKLNLMLQVIFALILCGIVLINQNTAEASSGSTVATVAMGGMLCWLIIRFFRSLWFYLTMACLLLGFAGASKFGAGVEGLADGSYKLTFTVFLLLGILLLASGKRKMAPFFLKPAALPLAVWVLIVFFADVAWVLTSYGQESGMALVKFEASALAVGAVLGLIAVAGTVFLHSKAGLAVGRLVFVEEVVIAEPVKKVEKPVSKRKPKVKKKKAPSAPKARPAVAKSIPKPTPAKADSGKKSVLDRKLEALCSAPTAAAEPKAAPEVADKKKEDGSSADSSKPAEKTTAETGKIVSSVDFS